jgi:hypothetical protein
MADAETHTLHSIQTAHPLLHSVLVKIEYHLVGARSQPNLHWIRHSNDAVACHPKSAQKAAVSFQPGLVPSPRPISELP